MTTKLSFRARALDAVKPMPIYIQEDVPDLKDLATINRTVPEMPTGMEKEEETVKQVLSIAKRISQPRSESLMKKFIEDISRAWTNLLVSRCRHQLDNYHQSMDCSAFVHYGFLVSLCNEEFRHYDQLDQRKRWRTWLVASGCPPVFAQCSESLDAAII